MDPTGVSGRTVVRAFVILVAVVSALLGAYAAFGMPGMDHGNNPMPHPQRHSPP